MRRIVTILGLLALIAGAGVLAGAGGDGGGKGEYTVELDNAFGLIEGGDLKVAGVRAGKITKIELDRRTRHALVGFKITRDGFGSLRSDVRCETRPQSLIGEYFVDCLPGTSSKVLPKGTTIPVSHTASTVGPDLVGNILRRPYRERLAIIINELGAGVAGNAGNLNDAIRRAVPALRETDKVLAKLATQNRTLAQLTVNADTVLKDLADNKQDVGRWVQSARDLSVASADRKADIAAGFRRLPAFLEELRPTMAALGATADAQTPTLRNLSASAQQLEELFTRLQPFSDANRPALRALARASTTGSQAVTAATPVVAQLRKFAAGTPELANNLRIILQHLDDPSHAVEMDPRAARATGRPAPTGYTGLEALLTYVYDQTMSTNVYDANEHVLKIGLIPPTSACADYANEKRYPQVAKECDTHLGPNQPGLNFTDPTFTPDPVKAKRKAKAKGGAANGDAGTTTGGATSGGSGSGSAAPGKKPALDLSPLAPFLPNLPHLPSALPKQVPNPGIDLGHITPLLDYLMQR